MLLAPDLKKMMSRPLCRAVPPVFRHLFATDRYHLFEARLRIQTTAMPDAIGGSLMESWHTDNADSSERHAALSSASSKPPWEPARGAEPSVCVCNSASKFAYKDRV